MASIGLTEVFIAALAQDSATDGCKYAAVKEELKYPIDFKNEEETAQAQLYGGDQLVEEVNEFSSGKITLGLTYDDDETSAKLLGHSSESKTIGTGEAQKTIKVVTAKGMDNAPFMGFAVISPKIKGGVRTWKADFFPKVKFKPYAKERKTKGNSIEFTTPSIEGTYFDNAKGEHHLYTECPDIETARAWLDSLFVVATAPENSPQT